MTFFNNCNLSEISPDRLIIVIGGGAAGVFAALAAKEKNRDCEVVILEKTAVFLSKVKVSGGGRCNVTHSCFDAKTLVKYYPRGEKELLGPFHHFQPKDTVEWFETKGTFLKTEPDGRMFPLSNQSQTIIDTLLNQADALGVRCMKTVAVESMIKQEELFVVTLKTGQSITCKAVILATGSSTKGHDLARGIGHTVVEPVPSLFTFNIPHFALADLSGVSIQETHLILPDIDQSYQGPLLITHFGLSGPAVLKLSAYGARQLHACQYETRVVIDWIPKRSEAGVKEDFLAARKTKPSCKVEQLYLYDIPKSLWKKLLAPWVHKTAAHLSNTDVIQMVSVLKQSSYHIQGKTTHKEEFVTCGGVSLTEVNFKTMESKKVKNLFFAGEVLDIDGITGGFNFQNAWTTGYIAGGSASQAVRP